MSNDNNNIVVNNPWMKLRQYTPARIALGRSGTSLPTKPHLEFQLAHARARNAVLHELNIPALQEALQSRSHEVLVLQSAAGNHPLYLQRPDKGRRLDLQSRTELEGRQCDGVSRCYVARAQRRRMADRSAYRGQGSARRHWRRSW